MAVSCGIDLEEVQRFERLLKKDYKDQMIFDIFSEKEIINANESQKPSLYYTLCFCCKEAFLKAIGLHQFKGEIPFRNIELYIQENQHQVFLSGPALELFKNQNYQHIQSNYQITDEYVVFKMILL